MDKEFNKKEQENNNSVSLEQQDETKNRSENNSSDTSAPRKILRKRRSNKKKADPSSPNHQSISHEPVINSEAQVYHTLTLRDMSIEELMVFATSVGVAQPENFRKQELVFATLKKLAFDGHKIIGSGILEKLKDGNGFLRSRHINYCPGADDIYIPTSQVSKHKLRVGDLVEGQLKPPSNGEKHFSMYSINSINDAPITDVRMRAHFEDLTPIFPNFQIKLENDSGVKPNLMSSRIIDMMAPLGKGQRALLVAPPRTGKTVLMQEIAHSISDNYPDINLIVLLIGERPEEVTDMSRSVKGEVVSSTFDEPSQRHVQLAEMTIERAKRLVETGKDVVVLLDSITRLARAYNDTSPSSGKILSGGVDSNALQKPKKFFGAARNIENGGSLTIIATALTETGSRMDEVIFEEFKGTGNAEIVLDRKVSDKRIFPAIDISKSGTRKEDLLIPRERLSRIWILRRITNNMMSHESVEFISEKLSATKSNDDFFRNMDTLNGGNK